MLAGGYFLLSLFIVGLVPELFSLPALANRWELALFMALFILTTAAFTGAVTPLFKDPEEVMLYVPFFSVGLIFLSGSSYPINGIPHFWQIVHYVFPSSPGILGYLKLNSMGGSLHHIIPQTATLLAQLLIYGSVFTLYLRKPGKRNNL
jgi:ABC-type multidrug transport system permease subunit